MTSPSHALEAPSAGPWLSPAPEVHVDPVAEAEAMADTHLAKQEEVERVRNLVRLLDDVVRVPGTKFGIGLDALVGLVLPGLGDAITGALGLTVITAAVRRGVPRVVIARMVLNLAIDLLVGLVPVLGDAFDLVWRSNTRNLALLERHQGELAPQARASDYALVAVAATLVTATVAAPFVLLYMLLGAIF
ncbi:MAG: DUF4112 domain-containing protein [Myxococcota bacterium]